jgi:hypothetical protein
VDLIPAFACGLGFGLAIGVALGLAWAAWGWLGTAYRHGLEDADARWNRMLADAPHCSPKSSLPPFRCNVVPLDPTEPQQWDARYMP